MFAARLHYYNADVDPAKLVGYRKFLYHTRHLSEYVDSSDWATEGALVWGRDDKGTVVGRYSSEANNMDEDIGFVPVPTDPIS